MNSLFAYTKTDSILHRTPAWIKLLVLFAVPVVLYLTPIWVCIALIPTFLLIALIAGIGVGRFLRDLRPIVIYKSLHVRDEVQHSHN